jgi:hypothetical protein
MPNPELLRTLDYILNRCDDEAIEVVAAAVVRRRRDLTLFGGAMNLPDPRNMARELSARIDINGAISGLRASVRDMAARIIRQEAPELSGAQVEALTNAWIPDKAPGSPAGEDRGAPPASTLPGGTPPGGTPLGGTPSGGTPPEDLMRSMIGQFVAFSQGTMEKGEDRELRAELGPWPERYWKAFPPVVRLFITDYLKGEINERDFRDKIDTALSMSR